MDNFFFKWASWIVKDGKKERKICEKKKKFLNREEEEMPECKNNNQPNIITVRKRGRLFNFKRTIMHQGSISGRVIPKTQKKGT